MLISGIQKFTLLDFPDRTACIVFTPGCDFRCGYCHNPEFVLPEQIAKLRPSFIPEAVFFNFLSERRGQGEPGVPWLEGVVITGGEPTLQPDLLPFMRRLKDLGLAVKLDTNGNRPAVIAAALSAGLLDYIALDVKTSLPHYPALVGPLVKPENIAESIRLIKDSSIPYEFRSTLIKEAHSDIILQEMGELIAGAKLLYLQQFRPGITLKSEFAGYHPFTLEELEQIAERLRSNVQEVRVR
ncbi:MAG: anaerobic ribonucleoside-triphosphate reductase activating protein [Candidatus Magasanikbacteria bacterium]|nr:anaerobic ribonucleoside-triphosphate reductase activating protein [Candidatus Magasanikbacteria bacterium]